MIWLAQVTAPVAGLQIPDNLPTLLFLLAAMLLAFSRRRGDDIIDHRKQRDISQLTHENDTISELREQNRRLASYIDTSRNAAVEFANSERDLAKEALRVRDADMVVLSQQLNEARVSLIHMGANLEVFRRDCVRYKTQRNRLREALSKLTQNEAYFGLGHESSAILEEMSDELKDISDIGVLFQTARKEKK